MRREGILVCICISAILIIATFFVTTNFYEKKCNDEAQELQNEIYQLKQEKVVNDTNIEEREKEIALIDVQPYDWAINIDNPSKIWFDYNIFNYGDVEAKDIYVICKLFDEHDEVRVSAKDNFGNLASNSWGTGVIETDNFPSDEGEMFSVVCYAERCEDCRILYKDIPELMENLEG